MAIQSGQRKRLQRGSLLPCFNLQEALIIDHDHSDHGEGTSSPLVLKMSNVALSCSLGKLSLASDRFLLLVRSHAWNPAAESQIQEIPRYFSHNPPHPCNQLQN